MSDDKDSSQTALRLVPKEPAPEILIHRFGEMELRCVVRDGEPWFFATDVCKALDIQNATKAIEALVDADKSKVTDPIKGIGFNIISESGLYRVMFKSTKPEAHAFQEWVTKEVLPAIRRTGQYVPQGEPSEEQKLLMLESATTGWRKALAANVALSLTIEMQAPKVALADMIADSKRLEAFRYTANKFAIPQKEFLELLNEWDIIHRKDRWHGTAWAIQSELVRDVISDTGHPQTKVTGKGLAYIGNRLTREGLMPWPKKGKK